MVQKSSEQIILQKHYRNQKIASTEVSKQGEITEAAQGCDHWKLQSCEEEGKKSV